MLFGARLVLVRDSSVSECIDLIEELTASSNWENLTTATSVNPYHIEGTKNAAFEIAEDFGQNTPDWVIVPAVAPVLQPQPGKASRN
jgi:threonine synthase|nr:pyridoxal-phosphate dependent enzyme [Mesotoga sp. UBA5557]